MLSKLSVRLKLALASACIVLINSVSNAAATQMRHADMRIAALTTAKPKADPAAYALLKDAHDHRQTFSENFPGITADVTFNDNGVITQGKMSSNNEDDITATMPGTKAEGKQWVEDQLDNLIGHRRSGSFDQDEGKYPITFGPDDHSPLGRQVVLHDSFQSSYRVRDHQLIDVTRTMGGVKFSITVLESMKTDEGKYLPHQFVVTYFEKNGAIDHVDDYTDEYTQIDGDWLPTSRRVITAADGKFTTRVIDLSNLQIAAK